MRKANRISDHVGSHLFYFCLFAIQLISFWKCISGLSVPYKSLGFLIRWKAWVWFIIPVFSIYSYHAQHQNPQGKCAMSAWNLGIRIQTNLPPTYCYDSSIGWITCSKTTHAVHQDFLRLFPLSLVSNWLEHVKNLGVYRNKPFHDHSSRISLENI